MNDANSFNAEMDYTDIRAFQGEKFEDEAKAEKKGKKGKRGGQSLRDIARKFQDEPVPILGKRESKSRFIMIGQDKVLKLNNYDIDEGESSVHASECKASVQRVQEPLSAAARRRQRGSVRQEAGVDFDNEDFCLRCWDGGDLHLCDLCPSSFHTHCIGPQVQPKGGVRKRFFCPQHDCDVCGRKAAAAGGLLFRCQMCPSAYCEDHLPEGKYTLLGANERQVR